MLDERVCGVGLLVLFECLCGGGLRVLDEWKGIAAAV